MDDRNQKIIDAIIQKAEARCPESLALIGVYGSAATGDTHSKSDLDLMILINDERGYQLMHTFILNDTQIGYDIYCTNWEMLESDAECNHAQLSKLLDSKLVYVNDQASLNRLHKLQSNAVAMLASEQRFEKAAAAFQRAKNKFADCFLSDSISDNRINAGAMIYDLLDCIMLYHGKYFHRGTKRTFDEVAELNLTFDMKSLVMNVIRAESVQDIRNESTELIRAVQEYISHYTDKKKPSADNLRGTYEEMYSNWKNKMPEAAKNDDLYSSFTNIVSLQYMLMEIERSVSISKLDVIGRFDPFELQKNVESFDAVLNEYMDEYKKIGMMPVQYSNVDEFVLSYLS